MLIARLKGGPLDTGIVNVQDTTKWIFLELAPPGVELSGLNMKVPRMRTAEWPDDEGPTDRPPGLGGPMACYRLLKTNRAKGKAEFEYDEKWSDEIVMEFLNEHPPR